MPSYRARLPTISQVKHVNDLARDIDNFEYARCAAHGSSEPRRQPGVSSRWTRRARGYGEYIHPEQVGENTIAGSRMGITKSWIFHYGACMETCGMIILYQDKRACGLPTPTMLPLPSHRQARRIILNARENILHFPTQPLPWPQ